MRAPWRSAFPAASSCRSTMGFLFGRWVGTVLVVAAATIGATIVFLAARYIFADAARKRLGALGEKINAGFTDNAFSYMLFLRLVPALSVLPREPGARVHVDPAAHVRAGDVHRNHSRHVRVREPGRDAGRASIRCTVSSPGRRSVRSRCWVFSRCCRWRGSAATPHAKPMAERPRMRLSIVIPALDEARGHRGHAVRAAAAARARPRGHRRRRRQPDATLDLARPLADRASARRADARADERRRPHRARRRAAVPARRLAAAAARTTAIAGACAEGTGGAASTSRSRPPRDIAARRLHDELALAPDRHRDGRSGNLRRQACSRKSADFRTSR